MYLHSLTLLYQYFRPTCTLPDPKGALFVQVHVYMYMCGDNVCIELFLYNWVSAKFGSPDFFTQKFTA